MHSFNKAFEKNSRGRGCQFTYIKKLPKYWGYENEILWLFLTSYAQKEDKDKSNFIIYEKFNCAILEPL